MRALSAAELYTGLMTSGHLLPSLSSQTSVNDDGEGEEEDEADEEVLDQVLDLVSGAAWDGDVEEARATRDTLYGLCGLEKPVVTKPATDCGANAEKKKKKTTQPQELHEGGDNSYSGLVNSMGY